MNYEGDFKNDVKNGEGCYEWLFGQKYVGNFTNGQIQGKGKFYWKEIEKDDNGNEKVVDKFLEGIFSNDKIHFFQKEIKIKRKFDKKK